MQKSLVIKGRLTGPRSVELDEAVSSVAAEVEVLVHPTANGDAGKVQEVIDFLQGLAPGTRSREDIDEQVRGERESWGDR